MATRNAPVRPLSREEAKKFSEELDQLLGKRFGNSLEKTSYLPSATVAFGHIPATIDERAYDHLPTKLGDGEKHFAGIPTLLGNPDEVFAHLERRR